MTNPTLAPQSDEYQQIHDGIIRLVDTARTETVRSINAIMTATYWEIGRRIVEFEQGGEARAAYGTQLIERLSVDLSQRYKRGFSTRNLWQIRTFYLCFQHIEIPQTLSAESSNLIPLAKTFPLPWSAYVRLLSVKNPDARTFYEKETLRNGCIRTAARQANRHSILRTNATVPRQIRHVAAACTRRAKRFAGASHTRPVHSGIS